MKSIRSSASPRRFVLYVTVLLLVGVALVSNLCHPAVSLRTQSAMSATSIGPSAFPTKLYLVGDHPCFPTGIHLAQANDVGGDGKLSMTLSLLLDYKACRKAKPTVLFGQGFFSEGSTEGGELVQFNYTSSKSNGVFQSPWIWHLRLKNLAAGPKRYWYKIVVYEEGRQVSTTESYHFWSPPKRHAPTSLALVGDLGQTENSTKTMEHIWRAASQQSHYNRYPVTQLLIAGDLSYADSDPYRWTSWFSIMEPLLRILPLHTAAGNHEIECDNVTREVFVPYERYFRAPNRLGDADIIPVSDDYRKNLWHGECSAPSSFQAHYDYGNAFYSYEHGLAKIIVLSSYSNSSVGSVQYEWFAAELDKIDRSATPWLIVSFHAPMYTSFLGHVDEIESRIMKESMEPLFLQYGVNFIISGHDHAYMRSYPMYKEAVDPTGKAPIYFTLGAAGNREQHSSGFRHEEPEDWVAQRDICDYGYGHLFLPNATHARFNWVRDGVSDMGIIDHVWLTNPHVLE